MADPVNPMGSLASSLPVVLSAAAPPKSPLPEKAPTAAPAAEPRPASVPSPTTDLMANPKAQELAVQQINANLQQVATDLKIQVDKDTGRTVFKIVNEKSGKVVLQVPSEEVLAIARNLKAMESALKSSGVLLDKEG